MSETETRTPAALAADKKPRTRRISRLTPASAQSTPMTTEVVKTKYQLGAELYESEHPGKDFGHLTHPQQAIYITRGEAAFNDGGDE